MMIKEIVRLLKKTYSYNEFATRNKHDPFRSLVSCILSLRTKDEVMFPASERLLLKADTPEKMLKLRATQIEKLIYPVGFYRRKARTILDFSKVLIDEYNSKVPDTIEELVKLKGVGRKTANIVVTYGHGKHGLAVDTHVHRISNRLGWVKTKTPEETEVELKRKLDKRYWIPINELLVRHGQNLCTPISPFCSKCFLVDYCKRVGVEKSR